MKAVLAALALCSLCTAEPPVGYNYNPPSSYQQPPTHNGYNSQSSSYLPPSTGYNPPSNNYLPPSNNYDSYNNNNYDSNNYENSNDYNGHNDHHGHGSEHEVPKSYEFGYSVKDAQSGNDYDRHESSDGDVVKGQYRVALPDGRTQIVTYTADWRTGFHADVRYEGEAHYPETNSNQNNGYNYNNPSDFSGSLTGFHGNANSGYKQPSTAYGPPGYH